MVKIGLLFPGQGSQVVGMGSGLVARNSSLRDYFSRASEVLGYDLFQLCIDGPDARLNATVHSQPALFVHSAAALADLQQRIPDLMNSVAMVAGLSLGEYSALFAAGVFSFEDGVRIVAERGSAMQDAASAVPSGMASVLGLEIEQVQKLCDDARIDGQTLQVANLLCPENIAISGHLESLARAEEMSTAAGSMKFIRLSVAGAFHTALMQPAVARLTTVLADVPMKSAMIPLVSNVDASSHTDPHSFRNLLSKQVVSEVRWEDSLRKMIAAGIDQFYEVGAGRVLAGTLKRIDRKIACECVGD